MLAISWKQSPAGGVDNCIFLGVLWPLPRVPALLCLSSAPVPWRQVSSEPAYLFGPCAYTSRQLMY